MILRNMSIETMVSKLKSEHKTIHIIYTPENAGEVVLRIYLKNTAFKGTINEKTIEEMIEGILDTLVRGIVNIINTRVVPLIRSRINQDGSITKNEGLWAISTTGTNIAGVLSDPRIDNATINTDAIQEIASVLGIEAARSKIMSSMRDIINVDMRHYMMYADTMTSSGKVTSIQSGGMKSRDIGNVLLKAGYSAPLTVFEDAALNCTEDTISGITAPLLLGTMPKLGSTYNSLYINSEFVKKNVKSVDDYMDDLEKN
jgi:DNA-directed RNA polymerase beta' subunit